MLTGDLIRARAYKEFVRPQFLKFSSDSVSGDARWLCDLMQTGLAKGSTRGSLLDVIKSEAQIRPDHKQLRGLAKVLFDASTFEMRSPVPPVELRHRIFREAAQRGPLALESGPFGLLTSTALLTELAQDYGLGVEALRDALYADRKEEQRLVACKQLDPERLIARYNVALVQSLLLKATGMTVTLQSPTAARVRQLLRMAKFHQLMHRATRSGKKLVLQIDGPASVLKLSTRYGKKLASFFPSVLWQERWVVEAKVVWKNNREKLLKLDPSHKLVSHTTDRGGYTSREAAWFQERFLAKNTDWTLSVGKKPIDLDGRAVVMPDFSFARDGKIAHLEIIGFWRKDYLERRVELLKKHGPGNLILAVSKRLVADKSKLAGFEGLVIPFGEIVPSAKVLAALEQVAR